MIAPAAVQIARARWRSAEDRLYPSLLDDPQAYQRGLAAVQAVLDELRRRADDVTGLITAESGAEDLLAAACPSGVPLPADVLVAVACGMRDREITAERQNRRRDEAVRAAEAAGAAWAVLDGPAGAAELTEGRRVALHLGSGTLVETIVDPWSREDRYSVTVMPGESSSFADRDAWLAEIARLVADVERAGPSGR